MPSPETSRSCDGGHRGEALLGRLRGEGYRLTPQRLALVRLLAEDNTHPSAEQVYLRLRDDYPTISLATVYNTLDVLVELGEALRLEINDGCTHFDVRRPSAHPHVVCRTCGRVEDLDLVSVDALAEAAERASDFRDLRPRFYFDGICPACAGRAASPEAPNART